jgi:hypothetical protein
MESKTFGGRLKTPDKWEIEDAARTLLRAEEIRADKKLMALVEKELAKKQKAISAITDK